MSGGRLEGKNAVISGGAAGVGGAASEIFSAEGAYVAIIDTIRHATMLNSNFLIRTSFPIHFSPESCFRELLLTDFCPGGCWGMFRSRRNYRTVEKSCFDKKS